eukprot:scaffold169236_cov23-Tisochrysis_lutea.AAC.1
MHTLQHILQFHHVLLPLRHTCISLVEWSRNTPACQGAVSMGGTRGGIEGATEAQQLGFGGRARRGLQMWRLPSTCAPCSTHMNTIALVHVAAYAYRGSNVLATVCRLSRTGRCWEFTRDPAGDM